MLITQETKFLKKARATIPMDFDPVEVYREMGVLTASEQVTDFVEALDAALAVGLVKIPDENLENVGVYWDIANGRLMIVQVKPCDPEWFGNDYYFMRQASIVVCKSLRLEHRKALAVEWQKTLSGYIEYITDEIRIAEEEWEREEANRIPEPHDISDIIQEFYENQLFGD